VDFDGMSVGDARTPACGEGCVSRWDEIMNGFLFPAQASMPGDDLLFHCLGSSTIGAVGFHGRVRDGIGWDTDAIATRQ
jgi:hypothetical protein